MATPQGRTLEASSYAGAQIKSLFDERFLKLKAGSHALEVDSGTFSRKIHGQVPFTVDELMKLARLLGVEPGQLLPRLDSNQQPSG